MTNDAQTHAFLRAAAETLDVSGPDPQAIVQAAARARRRRTWSALGVAAVVLVGGAGGALAVSEHRSGDDTGGPAQPPSSTVVINTWPRPSNVILEARVHGVLEMSATGCLYLRIGDAVIDTVWPYGFTTATDSEGRVVVQSGTGRIMARVGSELTAAGGSIPGVHNLACRVTPPRRDVSSLDGEFRMGSP
jgi:hypothetical protein